MWPVTVADRSACPDTIPAGRQCSRRVRDRFSRPARPTAAVPSARGGAAGAAPRRAAPLLSTDPHTLLTAGAGRRGRPKGEFRDLSHFAFWGFLAF